MDATTKSNDVGPSVNPYRRTDDQDFQPGHRVTCELCRRKALCFDQYGLTACRACHQDLLPGSGVY